MKKLTKNLKLTSDMLLWNDTVVKCFSKDEDPIKKEILLVILGITEEKIKLVKLQNTFLLRREGVFPEYDLMRILKNRKGLLGVIASNHAAAIALLKVKINELVSERILMRKRIGRMTAIGFSD